MRFPFLVARPFGVALGIFILVNLGLALKEPRLAANNVWLSVPLEEPWLSVFGTILGLALLAPHAWSARSGFRTWQIGIFVGFLLLALLNVGMFYVQVFRDRIDSHAAFPFSLFIGGILLFEALRVSLWKTPTQRLPRPARVFFGSVFVGAACFVMTVAHIYTFGMTDYSDFVEEADAVIVLGAKVYPDGDLSDALEYRMNRAIELWKEKKVKYLIYTGGVDASNLSEPKKMQAYAEREAGVPRAASFLDEDGDNTYLSAINCRAIARDRDFSSFFVVSQYYHNARVKMIFERSGVRCYTVPANDGKGLERNRFFLFREAVAFPYYLLFRH
jgi:vancomycin permeability regulator SanA